jgi:hypothetical protein
VHTACHLAQIYPVVDTILGAWETSPEYNILRLFKFSGPAAIFANVAKSITRYIRSINFNDQRIEKGQSDTAGFVEPGPVVGTVWFQEVYIAIRWPWLAFSESLLILTILFLVAIVAQSLRLNVGVWKTSPLAPMFHGFNATRVDQIPIMYELNEMKDKARGIRVKFMDTGSDIGLEEE